MVDLIGSPRPASEGSEEWTLAEARIEVRGGARCRLVMGLEMEPWSLHLDWKQDEKAIEERNHK